MVQIKYLQIRNRTLAVLGSRPKSKQKTDGKNYKLYL